MSRGDELYVILYIFLNVNGLSDSQSKIHVICMCRWWKKSGFPEVTFIRHRYVEFYTLVSGIDMDPKHSAFRPAFVKMCHLVTLLDDMYDTFGTIDELQLFTAAVKR